MVGWTPGASVPDTCCNRSATSVRALTSSVPSLNSSVSCDRPNLVSERIVVMPGTPIIARSSGIVTRCSIKAGDSAGTGVLTWTCTPVMSGTASIGSEYSA